jgi:photosystem II stability/assembly factor-like uncharacterized protein
MKNLLLLILISASLLFPQSTKTLIRQATLRGDITSMCYIPATNTIFAGIADLTSIYTNLVYKSTDLGLSWQKLPSCPLGPNDNLYTIFFLDNNTGWISSHSNGVIYYTSNGGQTWSNRSPAKYNTGISDLMFFNGTTGYACGSTMNYTTTALAKTTDGGLTWDTLTTPNTSAFNSMYWADVNNGWASGNSGHICRTTDGGLTWKDTSVTGNASGTSLNKIIRVDANTFYAFGSKGLVFKSTDGGITFRSGASAGGVTLYSGYFSDANNGIVVGTQGASYRTTDGGANWIATPLYSLELLHAVIKINNTYFVGGYKSTLFSTTDNGVTFTKLADDKRDMYSVYVENSNTYLAVGGGSGLLRGEVNYTTNAGTSWIKTNVPIPYFFYDGVKFGNYIYICGQTGGYFVSSNLGNTWTPTLVGTSTTNNYKMNFLNETNGYLVNNEANIYYTTNRGVNWTSQITFASTTLYKIQMLSSTIGFAVGSGSRIFATTDGSTWSNNKLVAPAEQLTGLYMLDQLNGYACGQNGVVYKTTDGFQSVSLMTDTTGKYGILMRDVFAFSPTNVWAVSNKGFIYKSSSLNTLSIVDTSSFGEDLMTISKLSGSSFLVSGGDGSVYKIVDLSVPVELTSFNANVTPKGVALAWTTATEKNNKGFDIERKELNSVWHKIGFIQGKGTTLDKQSYSFTDSPQPGQKYTYRLKQIDYDGSFQYSNEVETNFFASLNFSLEQNYPNPFNPSTVITYSLPKAAIVKLSIYNALGQTVNVLENSFQESGTHNVSFNADGFSSGIYFYRLEAAGYSQIRKMTLLK